MRYTLKEKAEALVAATREIELDVSADKTKYMVMCRDQNELDVSADKTKYMVMCRDKNAERNHSVRIDNSTFERVEEFKYLEQL